MIEMGESAVAYDVNQISEKVRETLAGCPEVVAALLMGSCSRGEETYFINGRGERELLSDYEMLIIVHDKMDTKVSDNKLKLLASELKGQSSSPCFELEWSYKTEHQIKKLDKRFIFFEARESACTIYGNKSAIELFPVINIKNLNFCELNTVIIHRLYHVLRDCLNTDEHYQQYLIARNTLDIPTAALPLCGILQSSYGRRNKSFSEYALQYGFSEELMGRVEAGRLRGAYRPRRGAFRRSGADGGERQGARGREARIPGRRCAAGQCPCAAPHFALQG